VSSEAPDATREASEATAFVRLAPADVAASLALSDAAGWNQTAFDWQLFIDHGQAFGMRAVTGGLVATAAMLSYGSVAWVSMVLVAEAWRQRGLATALLDACVTRAQRLGARPILDATPAGAAVYRRLGFAPGLAFERWQGPAGDASATCADDRGAISPRLAARADMAAIAALDRSANGLDRHFLLEALLARPGTQAWLSADGRGFVFAREGRRATQIGPLVAADPAAALSLLSAVLGANRQQRDRNFFLDVPVRQRELVACLEQGGFTRQRSFLRMAHGAPPSAMAEGASFVFAGPEFG
jgi:GNAT superfamily N-acetyltransferase